MIWLAKQGHEVIGVAEEIKKLYSKDYEIDLAHVESVFEINPEFPYKHPERTEYKFYRLSSR